MLKDEQRSYFGLGWEYARKGEKRSKNPFPKYSYAFDQFFDGYNSFRKSETSDYSIVDNSVLNMNIPDNLLAEKKDG